jgi:SAM-dependent methyltransferase
MSKLFDSIKSKVNLYRTLGYARVYHYIRFKFKPLIDKKDRKIVSAYCKKIEPVIEETEHFYSKVNSISVSYSERKEKGLLENISLTYGETPWKTCVEIIKELEISKKDIFYDLGCGSGRLVFLFNRQFGIKSVGIDLIENFIKISNIVCKNLDLTKIKFINGNFLKKNLSDGTIFYITATCFDPDLVEQIADKLKEIKQKSKVIIITRQLNCEHLKLYKTKKFNFGWARDTAYFYEKV